MDCYITTLVPPNYHMNATRAIQYLYGLLPCDNTTDEQSHMHTYTREVAQADLPPAPQGWDTWFDNVLQRVASFKEAHPDPLQWYHKFYIPKASGGFREINAPCDDLKDLQRHIVYMLSHTKGKNLSIVHAHDCAYAYIEHRSTKDTLHMHQKNDSHWFLKLDVRNFFPSCKTERVLENLQHIYPLCYIPEDTLRTILSVCVLNDALPQGAPTSPFLTNMLMIPIDKAISDLVYTLPDRHYVYTRYADDLLISSRESFPWSEVQERVAAILQPQGFELKREKTRYGARAGSNWNLGLMLNKDNEMTLGHKHKQRMRAAVFSFLKDFSTGNPWDIEQTQILAGQLSYLESIEPGYKSYIIAHYETKTGVTFRHALNQILHI